jgi:hypothetical protein
MSTHIFLTATGLLLLSGLAFSGDPPRDDPDVAKLVKDLGSPRFAVRKAAEQKLAALGAKAKAAVQVGTKDPDAEVARRCEAMLPKVRAAERKALVAGEIDWPAPAGTHFRDLAGDTKEARKLFALMTEDDHRAALADVAADDSAGAAKLYSAEVARLAAATEHIRDGFVLPPPGADRDAVLASYRNAHREAVGPADVTLALYLGSFALPSEAPDPAEVGPVVRQSFFDLATGPVKEPFVRLFSAWLDRRRDPFAVQGGLKAALFGHIAEAVPVARRWVADPKAFGPTVGSAVLVLGMHGSKEDLRALSALRDDLRSYRGTPGRGTAVELGDVAAAMSLVIRSEDISKFGFRPDQVKRVWSGADSRPYTDVGSFASADARTAALKKTWEWLDKQPDAPPKPAKSGR